jgi:hypothetical protein
MKDQPPPGVQLKPQFQVRQIDTAMASPLTMLSRG